MGRHSIFLWVCILYRPIVYCLVYQEAVDPWQLLIVISLRNWRIFGEIPWRARQQFFHRVSQNVELWVIRYSQDKNHYKIVGSSGNSLSAPPPLPPPLQNHRQHSIPSVEKWIFIALGQGVVLATDSLLGSIWLRCWWQSLRCRSQSVESVNFFETKITWAMN